MDYTYEVTKRMAKNEAARVQEYWQLLDCVETATLDAAVCHLLACFQAV